MSLRKGFRITTWVLSIILFIGGIAFGIFCTVEGYSDYFVGFMFAFASFVGIWLAYWMLFWLVRLVRGFRKTSNRQKQLIIMWAGITIFVLIGIFVPTEFTKRGRGFDRRTYRDVRPLVMSLTATALVTFGLMFTLREKKYGQERGEQ